MTTTPHHQLPTGHLGAHAQLLRDAGFTAVAGHPDLSGRPRSTSGRAPR